MKNFEMSSDLTIQTTEPNRDLYLYKTKGRGAHFYQDVTGEVHGVGVQRNVRFLNNITRNLNVFIIVYTGYIFMLVTSCKGNISKSFRSDAVFRWIVFHEWESDVSEGSEVTSCCNIDNINLKENLLFSQILFMCRRNILIIS